jgi:iron complex transport system substrate-binding protein
MEGEKDEERTAAAIIEAALWLHRTAGPGMLESVYELALTDRLQANGLHVIRQKRVSVEIAGRRFQEAFRIDLLVDNCVVVEVKSVDALLPVHTKQLLTYLRLAKLSLGLLINFGGDTLKSGLRRVVNGFAPSSSSRLRVNQLEASTDSSEQDVLG